MPVKTSINVPENFQTMNIIQFSYENEVQESSVSTDVSNITPKTEENNSNNANGLNLHTTSVVTTDSTLLGCLKRIEDNINCVKKQMSTIESNIISHIDKSLIQCNIKQNISEPKQKLEPELLDSLPKTPYVNESFKPGFLNQDSLIEISLPFDKTGSSKFKFGIPGSELYRHPFKPRQRVKFPKKPLNQPRIPDEWKKDVSKYFRPTFIELDENDEFIEYKDEHFDHFTFIS